LEVVAPWTAMRGSNCYVNEGKVTCLCAGGVWQGGNLRKRGRVGKTVVKAISKTQKSVREALGEVGRN